MISNNTYISIFWKKKFFNHFILIIIISTNLIILSLTDIIIIWFIIEINNFIFLSFILINNSNKKIIFFYYSIQFISSSFLIINLILSFSFNLPILKYSIILILILKLSIPPLHIWILIIINHLNWPSIILILTIQKTIPFYMLSFFLFNSLFLWFFISLSLIFAPLNLLNIINYKLILLYSSINQSRWFIILMFIKNIIWLLYFFLYSIINFIIIYSINFFKIYFNNKIINSFKFSLIILLLFFNLASLPPFRFFILKWINIFIFFINFKLNLIFFLFLFNSLIIVYIYINISYIFIFIKSINNKLFIIKALKINLFSNILIFFSFFFSLILLII